MPEPSLFGNALATIEPAEPVELRRFRHKSHPAYLVLAALYRPAAPMGMEPGHLLD